jgi:hypothetical protein
LRWIAFAPAFYLELLAATQVLVPAPAVLTLVGSALLHIGACAIFGWAYVGRDGANRTRQVLAGSMAFLGFPAFGMLAVLVGSAVSAVVWMRRPALPAWSVPDVEEIPQSDAGAQIDMLPALQVVPFGDLLCGDDPDMKRAAADALVKTRSNSAVDQLKTLLRDSDLETRLSASLRLVALEDEIGLETQTARAAVEQSPEDADAWSALADVYLNYAASGLSDLATNRQYLQQALQAYDSARRLNPHLPYPALAIARAHLALGDIPAAQLVLEQATDSQTEVDLLHMEIAFRLGDYKTLACRARLALPSLRAGHPNHQLVEWWAAAS